MKNDMALYDAIWKSLLLLRIAGFLLLFICVRFIALWHFMRFTVYGCRLTNRVNRVVLLASDNVVADSSLRVTAISMRLRKGLVTQRFVIRGVTVHEDGARSSQLPLYGPR